MPVGASEPNGMVWRGAVEIVTGGEDGRVPSCFDPAPAGDPIAGGRRDGLFADTGQHFIKARRALEIQGEFAEPDTAEMDVRIRQPGNNGLAFKVNPLSRGDLVGLHVGATADEENPVALNREGFGLGWSGSSV